MSTTGSLVGIVAGAVAVGAVGGYMVCRERNRQCDRRNRRCDRCFSGRSQQSCRCDKSESMINVGGKDGITVRGGWWLWLLLL